MGYLEIGEIREMYGVKVQCMEIAEDLPFNCKTQPCAFWDTLKACPSMECSRGQRADERDVYFKKIE